MSHPRCDPLPSVEGENSIPTPPTPLVTVAITAYERADLFRLCLASVCRQLYRNLEIYVFDNSNTDAVQNCVTEIADDRIVYTRNTSNIRDLIIINHQKAWIQRAGVYHIVLSSDCGLNERAIELMSWIRSNQRVRPPPGYFASPGLRLLDIWASLDSR